MAYAAGGGVITLNGATSGTVTVQVPAVAGSTTFQLPGNNGTNTYVLSTDGTGVTSWVANGGPASSALSAITSATAAHSFDNTSMAQTWTWNTLTTQTAFTLSSSSLTNGNILSIQNTAAAATSTGQVLSISDATTGPGYGVYSSMTGAANTGYAGYFTNTATSGVNYGIAAAILSGSGTAVAGYANSGGTNNSNGVYGASNANGGNGVYGYNTNGSGTGIGVYGVNNTTGAGYGVQGQITGAANTGYAGYFSNTGTGAVNYGLYASTSSTTGYAGYFAGPTAHTGLLTASGGVTLTGLSTGTNADTLCKTTAGVVTIDAGNTCGVSKRILKENFLALDGHKALQDLAGLQPTQFNLKKTNPPDADPNATHTQYGFIAEEVAAVDPYLALYDSDMKTPKNYRTTSVLALLVKGFQEQQAEMKELKKLDDDLGAENASLRRDFEAYKQNHP